MKRQNNLELDLKYKEFVKEPIDRSVLAKYGVFKRTRLPKRKGNIVYKHINRKNQKKYIDLFNDEIGYYICEFNRINGSMELNYKTKEDE